MARLGERAGWVSLGRLANTVSLLLANIVLARSLSATELGYYQKTWMFISIGVPLSLFGLPMGISYFLPRLRSWERGGFLRQQVLLMGAAALLFGAGLGLLAPWAAQLLGGTQLTTHMRLAAVIGAGMIASGFWEPFLIVYGRHRWLAVSLFLFALFFLGAVLFGRFVVGSVHGIFLCLAVYAVCRLVLCAGVLVALTRPASAGWRGDWLRQQLGYSFPVGLRDAVGVLARFTDKLIANFHVSAGQFALYYQGAWELPLVGLLIDSLLSVLMPDFAAAHGRGDTRRMGSLMDLAARRIALLVFPVAVFSFVAAPDIMELLYGPYFRASGRYFRVYSLILFCRISTGGVVLLAAGRPGRVLLGAVGDIVLALGLGLALLPRYGLLAPAAAMVFSTCCQVAYNLHEAGVVVGRRLYQVLPWRHLAVRLLLSGVAGALAASSAVFAQPLENVLAVGTVLFLVYFGVGLLWPVFDAEERALMAGAWRMLRRPRGAAGG